MAGPLNLDNYELKANESNNDELVITHTPTGKTTTLAEDTFRTIAAEELSVEDTKLASAGDYVNLASYTPMESTRFRTTSTSYVATDSFGWRISWDDHFPANANTAMAPLFSVSPGTDESVDVQLYNQIDNEVVFEQLDIATQGAVNPGPILYTPSTTGTRVRFQVRIRTDPGTNSSTIKEPHCYAGVQL